MLERYRGMTKEIPLMLNLFGSLNGMEMFGVNVGNLVLLLILSILSPFHLSPCLS